MCVLDKTMDIRGYIDRGNFVVNLDCQYGPHLLVSVHSVGEDGVKAVDEGYRYFSPLRALI